MGNEVQAVRNGVAGVLESAAGPHGKPKAVWRNAFRGRPAPGAGLSRKMAFGVDRIPAIGLG